MSLPPAELESLVDGACRLQKFPLARLVSVFEDTRPVAIASRVAVMERLTSAGFAPKAAVLGLTGTPGAGKSSLLGQIALRLLEAKPGCAVAVLAVDPSSQRSGGALLGDRTRVHLPVNEQRVYFRSQASDRELGGLGRATYSVVRVLERLFDYVFVETVGIGQSEIEVERLADRVYLVMQPMAGDQVQFMKAGIMEVPHVFILNKYDAGETARRSYHALRASIDFARPGEAEPPPILRTSAVTGEGLDAFVEDIVTNGARQDGAHARESYFLEKWVRDEFGRFGLDLLRLQGGPDALLAEDRGFEAAQAAFRVPTSPL